MLRFDKYVSQKESSKLPLLNYLFMESKKPYMQEYYQLSRKKRLMWLYQRSPEAQMVIEPHARDICGKIYFQAINPRNIGTTLVKRADNFARSHRFNKLLFNFVIDTLITGEGYLWKGELSKQQVKMIQEEFSKMLNTEFYDEDFFRLRKVRQVASTTMATNFDDYDVTGYTQTLVGGSSQEVQFSVNDIIRMTFGELDGKIQGWSPLYTLPLHLELLWLLWTNQYDFQERGNHPDLVVIGETLKSNSPSFKAVEQKLAEYNTPGASKHGTLLLSDSKFTVQELERMDTLQFKEVGMFITSMIGALYQYPQSRLPIKTDQAAGSKDSNNSAEKSYWNIVEQKQELVAEVLNTQLWEPYFGVQMKFEKSYKHDEVVEGQAIRQRLDNIGVMDMLVAKHGKQIPLDVKMRLMEGKDAELYVEDAPMLDLSMDPNRPNQANSDLMNSQEKDPNRQDKRQSELKREEGAGVPNGV